jgi:hypothetical protein
MMVFNDDIGFQDEVSQGLVAKATPAQFSNLWDLVRVVQKPQRKYNYTTSILSLLDLNELTKKTGAKLGVVIFRNRSSSPAWRQLVQDVTDGLRGTDIPLLDLGTALLATSNDRGLRVHPIDPHPNEIAHRIAAEEIEKFLRSHRMLPS